MARFIWPITNHRVTQNFGANAAWYRANVGQNGHNGTDLGHPIGTPVKASADGTVEFEGWGKNHGWMGSVAGIAIILNHGDVYTGYAHLNSTIISRGQKVKQGQTIGYVGQTGTATGPHLHFEFIGKPINFNNGFAGRLNPSAFNVGKTATSSPATGGGKTVNESDLTALYKYGPLSLGGYQSRGRKSKEGSNVYLGKSAAFVISDFFNSKEAKEKRADMKNKINGLEAEIAKLKKQGSAPDDNDAEKKLKAIKDALGIN